MQRGDFDAIVLGGGVGGLTAGAILAANGARVLLLERDEIVGGRARVVRHGPYNLPTGPHSFPRDVVDAALARAGVEAPLYPRPGRYRMYNVPRGRMYPIMEAGTPWEETIEKFNLSSADARGLRDLLDHVDPDTWQGKTARRWIEDMKLPPRVARICSNSSVWATDGAMTVDVISMDLFPMSVFALFIGELGWMEYSCDQRLHDVLRERIEKNGAVECGARAVALELENGGVGRVFYTTAAAGSLWEASAPAVVSNIPMLELHRGGILRDPLPQSLAARLRSLEAIEPYLGGLITVWYGLRRSIVPGGDSIGFFDEDIETGTHTVPRGYFRAYSTTVPTLAPPQRQLLHVDGYILPTERRNWRKIAEKTHKLDRMARRYVEAQGWGSLDGEIEFQETTIAHHLWGAYNWSIFRPCLPDTVCDEIRGLYFAGNMVKSTPGLFGVAGAVDSGMRAADAVLSTRA